MFIAGHTGLGLAMFAPFKRALGERGALRLRWLIFFALLPDILDKPMGILWWELSTRRLFGHSLLCTLLVIVLCRLLWPKIAPYAWLVPTHLLLDAMWLSPHTLFFPFLGWRFDPDPLPPPDLAGYIRILIWKITHQPWVLGGEIIGAAFLLLYWLLVVRPQRARQLPAAGTRPLER